MNETPLGFLTITESCPQETDILFVNSSGGGYTVNNIVSSTLYQLLFSAADLLPYERCYTHNLDIASLKVSTPKSLTAGVRYISYQNKTFDYHRPPYKIIYDKF